MCVELPKVRGPEKAERFHYKLNLTNVNMLSDWDRNGLVHPASLSLSLCHIHIHTHVSAKSQCVMEPHRGSHPSLLHLIHSIAIWRRRQQRWPRTGDLPRGGRPAWRRRDGLHHSYTVARHTLQWQPRKQVTSKQTMDPALRFAYIRLARGSPRTLTRNALPRLCRYEKHWDGPVYVTWLGLSFSL